MVDLPTFGRPTNAAKPDRNPLGALGSRPGMEGISAVDLDSDKLRSGVLELNSGVLTTGARETDKGRERVRMGHQGYLKTGLKQGVPGDGKAARLGERVKLKKFSNFRELPPQLGTTKLTELFDNRDGMAWAALGESAS